MRNIDILLEKYGNWKNQQDLCLSSFTDRVFNEGYGPSAYGPYLSAATGCHVVDINGNTFLDTAMAGGTAILGHANPITKEAIKDQLEKGSLYTAANAMTHAVVDKVLEVLPWFDKAVLCSTGSEATLRAIRIARASTGKRKIGVFCGGWHGAHDQVLFEEDPNGPEEAPVAMAKGKGIPPIALEHLVLLPYNHPAAFDLIRRSADDLAMVLVEPAQGSNPRDDIGDFLKELRQVTRELDIVLGFDEIITGFRLAPGGGQEHFGVQADIATYGKTLGGGLPIGMVVGTGDVMSVVRDGPVFMGGTFSANPLTMAATLATMNQLQPEIYSSLDQNGNELKAAINDFCATNDIAAHMIGVGSMLRLIFAAPPVTSRRHRDQKEVAYARQADFYAALLMNGVHVAGNRINFLSTAHGDREMSKLLLAYTETLSACAEAGFFDRLSK